MSLWFRLGPVGISSPGRVGVRAGLSSAYGSGYRRRRKSTGGGGIVLLGFIFLVGLLVVYWKIAIPLLLAATILAATMAKSNSKRRQAEYQAWLAGPPPPFSPPRRFTQKWIAENVPSLHPGQVPLLLDELGQGAGPSPTSSVA
jgi:hypothetical protein